MSEHIYNSQQKQATLKQLIRELHQGASVDDVKARFQALTQDVSASEIAYLEQALIAEGLPETEVKRLCDVHVAVFRDSLDAQAPAQQSAPAGHPLTTLRAENAAVPAVLAALTTAAQQVQAAGRLTAAAAPIQQARAALARLMELDRHYLRKEHLLFPFLERHGMSGPSTVMWAIHDDIRARWKALDQALAAPADYGSLVAALDAQVEPLATMISEMAYKEEHILFPAAQEKLAPAEWLAVWEQGDEFGYALGVSPAAMDEPPAAPVTSVPAEAPAPDHRWPLDTGALSLEEVNLLLNHLPVDVTFVDDTDSVRYFSRGPERIFPRPATTIGRQVQKCHPPASVHVVQGILDDFRAGRRDEAEFWIQAEGRFLHIRYFAMHGAEGRYRGTLEVSQDVTGIRQLTGERRILQDQA
ncbi:MAG: DUF438 domain-containing protein [Chloroflexi bacterium]|nr:DUF438 domain-containing protein [Chloroflexota bacterium]MBU1751614.1 DUF438 domain-containing protein [Chloroflexota bacterium]